MSVGSSLQKVVDAIASFERNGTDVTSIETREPDLSSSSDLTVQFTTTHQLFDADQSEAVLFSIDEASIDPDGTLHLDMTATAEIDGDDSDATEHSEARVDSIPDVGSKPAGDGGTNAGQARDDYGPPRDEDPEALRAVYAECDSFRKMRDALDSEVTPETIRRRMISYGIHTVPTDDEDASTEADDTQSDESDADNIGAKPRSLSGARGENAATERDEVQEPVLPDGGNAVDLSVDELVDVVQTSDTIYQAHQKLEMDQDRTRRLLRKYGLIDLVMGRAATLEDRSVAREEIERRIRSTAQSSVS